MDDATTDAAGTRSCEACGRTFVQMNAYSNHIGSCRPGKKRLASALEMAKEKYRHKKSRLEKGSIAQLLPPPISSPQPAPPEPTILEVRSTRLNICLPCLC